MDTQIVIVSTIIFISIFLPLFLLMILGKTQFKNTIKLFNNFAKKNNLNLNQKEFWGNTFIGMDESLQILLYKKGFEGDEYKILNLNEINHCEIIKHETPKTINKVVIYVLNTIDLKLTLKTNNTPYMLNFYDIVNEISEDFEYKRAEEWAQIINKNLTVTVKKKAA